MRRPLLATMLALGLVLAAPAGGAGIVDRKEAIDDRIAGLQAKIDNAQAKEGVLTDEISAVTAKIRILQGDVDSASGQLAHLEAVLALQQRKLDRLNELFHLQTTRLIFLQRQYVAATGRLNRRLIQIYTEDEVNALAFVFDARSFSDLLDQLELMNDIGRQDERIAGQVEHAKTELRATRERTKRTRARVTDTRDAIAARTTEQRRVRDRLLASRNELASVRSLKREALSSVQQTREEYLHEVEALQAQSAALAARIRAAQAAAAAQPSSSPVASVGSPSASGLVWPVSGPVTSGFGWRWGRMHEGIDIAVPSGTPVVAAQSGTIIYAGWMGGYGNLVVVDHGAGLATAYGHNTSVAAGTGQSVARGQVIAYSGNTGNSTGPHVHFEVRVNGAPVDPLGYL